MVEHSLGKGEVMGSSPIISSRFRLQKETAGDPAAFLILAVSAVSDPLAIE